MKYTNRTKCIKYSKKNTLKNTLGIKLKINTMYKIATYKILILHHNIMVYHVQLYYLLELSEISAMSSSPS